MTGNQSTSTLGSFRSEVLLMFGLVFALFLLTFAGFDTSEGGYHYAIARQILTEGSLSFDQPRQGIYTTAPNGRTYASHEIGNTLFLLPVAGLNLGLEKVLAHRQDQRRIDLITGFFLSVMSPVYCALTAVLLYVMLRSCFMKSMAASLSGSLSFAFCTFVWTYSRNLFDGVLSMCLLTGAMLSMMYFKKTKRPSYFLLATVLLGFGVITRLSMVLSLLAFAVYLIMTLWNDRKRMVLLALIGVAALLPFAAWQLYYNHLRTGHLLLSPVQTAQYAANNGLTGNLGVGIFGLLCSPGKSIIVYVPIVIISAICFPRFASRYASEAVFVGLMTSLWLLLHAKIVNWPGNWSWGPRYFLTITPVLVLPACVNWEWLHEKVWRRYTLMFVLAWGGILSVSSIIGNWHFRMALAGQEGRSQAMIWSVRGSQPVDMLVGDVSNLHNILFHLEGAYLPQYSPINRYASNTINIWFNTAAYAGVPRVLLAGAVFFLMAVATYCLAGLRSKIRRGADVKAV